MGGVSVDFEFEEREVFEEAACTWVCLLQRVNRGLTSPSKGLRGIKPFSNEVRGICL